MHPTHHKTPTREQRAYANGYAYALNAPPPYRLGILNSAELAEFRIGALDAARTPITTTETTTT